MPETRDWGRNRAMWIRVLEKQTGKGLDHWNRRIRAARHQTEDRLRAWLETQGISGYARTLLIMERFGYPDFFTASAAELIDRQYADRPHLRPIYDAIVEATQRIGEVVVQARKGYVSLVTPRRTFARVQATTLKRVDIGLRLEGRKPGGRLRPSRFHETMPLQVSLEKPRDLDAEVRAWLRAAYEENR